MIIVNLTKIQIRIFYILLRFFIFSINKNSFRETLEYISRTETNKKIKYIFCYGYEFYEIIY